MLQLHHREVEHDHGPIGDPDGALGNGVLLWFGDVAEFDAVVARAAELGPTSCGPRTATRPRARDGPGHREIWISDPDGYTVVVASPDGEAYEPASDPGGGGSGP